MGKILASFAVPGGLLVVVATLAIASGIGPFANPAFTEFYFYGVFAGGMLLAFRFRSTRILLGLLVLGLAERALLTSGPGQDALMAHSAVYPSLAVLVPINLVLLLLLPERGFAFSALAPALGFVLLESVAVTVLARPENAAAAAVLRYDFLSARWFAWSAPPQIALLLLLLALVIFAARFLVRRQPLDSGLFWCAVAFFLGLQSRNPAAFLTTAGLVLVVAQIETSYRMAYQDELTGLPGRRAFRESLGCLQDAYALAMVDVDHFKKFNDVYGHETGDHVLRMVASRLARVSGGGQAFRCGGEEFAVLFPGKRCADAAAHLEHLRQSVEGQTFVVRSVERRTQARGGSDRRK
ncbi:MAG: GGDEF domain-containing protein, partial [Terriglobales bacterium]